MTDYTELVKALRCCCPQPEETCDGCPYDTAGECNISRMMFDAAAAIEALQAKVKRLEQERDELIGQMPELTETADGWKWKWKPHWVSVEERLPEPHVQCLVRDDDGNCAVGYYRQDAKAWDSPFFGWLERDDEYYKDGDLCRIGKVVAWMPIEPPQEVQDDK